jgi:hypothetical protein
VRTVPADARTDDVDAVAAEVLAVKPGTDADAATAMKARLAGTAALVKTAPGVCAAVDVPGAATETAAATLMEAPAAAVPSTSTAMAAATDVSLR